MSRAFLECLTAHLAYARITFDKFLVVWHASTAVDKMRRSGPRTDRSLKGMRWSLLQDRSRLKPEAAADAVIVRTCYQEVTDMMQSTLDRLAAERRFPIPG